MGFSPNSLETPKEPTTMSEVRGSKYEEKEPRRGPWTVEEDTLLIHYIACHGEGRWNLLASQSGLKRTGKSCRLRWLNYLKPDLKRGNLSPEEQFIILELHSKWGNRWSRIAQYLPGRTDNEIKNYWRTRVQKQAKQLGIDTNDTMFRDAVRCHWMPRLLEKMSSSGFVPSIITTDLDQTPHAPPPCALNPSIQSPFDSFSFYNVSGSQKCSQTISLGSTTQRQFAEVSEFPWCYPGEHELGNADFNILLQGDMCMRNASDMDASDLPFATASECAAAENNLISNIDESLLCRMGKFQEWSGF